MIYLCRFQYNASGAVANGVKGKAIAPSTDARTIGLLKKLGFNSRIIKQNEIYAAIKNETNRIDIRCLRIALIIANIVPTMLTITNNHIKVDKNICLNVSPLKVIKRLIITGVVKILIINNVISHFRPVIKIDPTRPAAAQIPKG